MDPERGHSSTRRAPRTLKWAVLSVAAAVTTTLVRPAFGWDDFGHLQVTAEAYEHLKPDSKHRAAELVRLNPRYSEWTKGVAASQRDRVAFILAATWADAIKSDPEYTDKNDQQSLPAAAQNHGYTDKLRHRYWHFVDQPFSPDHTPMLAALAPNAQTQIEAFRATIAYGEAEDALKSYDLVWLLHLVGDLHQPLHCVSRYDAAAPSGDRGGNSVRITGASLPTVCDDAKYCKAPPNELHAFFDDITGEGNRLDRVTAAVKMLPKVKDSLATNIDVAAWLKEGLESAETAVYVSPIGVGDGPFTIDASYERAALALARHRIALAGLRLAQLLDDVLVKEAAAKKQRNNPHHET